MLATMLSIVHCPNLTEPINGMMNCSLGDDGVPSYEDTCSFMCNTGYNLTGNETRLCENDSNWTGSEVMCKQGNFQYRILNLIMCAFIRVTA